MLRKKLFLIEKNIYSILLIYIPNTVLTLHCIFKNVYITIYLLNHLLL